MRGVVDSPRNKEKNLKTMDSKIETSNSALQAAVDGACKKIAPMWPLKSFVAVNPFLGFSEKTFHETCASIRRVNRIDMLMPRDFYREAINSGAIEDQDIIGALKSAPADWASPKSLAEFKSALAQESNAKKHPKAVVATISEVLDKLASGNRQISRTSFMVDEISKFCSSYYDEGQALLPYPGKKRSLYSAWLLSQRFDRNPEVMGVSGFRKVVGQVPKDPLEAIAFIVQALGIPTRALEDYLYRALFDIGGWASYVRHLVWTNNLYGKKDESLVELLAVRVVWGYALFLERTDSEFTTAWKSAMENAAKTPDDVALSGDADLATDVILQEAYERAYQRKLIQTINDAKTHEKSKQLPARKKLQAAFCIDVRSEVFRRALETACPEVETVGFAGFFGVPIEFIQVGDESGPAQCPVLLKPNFTIYEGLNSANEEAFAEIVQYRILNKRLFSAWKKFKLSAVSCFAYVETLGLLFLTKIIRDSARISRPVPNPKEFGIKASVFENLCPAIQVKPVDGRATGFTDDQMVLTAKSVLKAMSLTKEFSSLVLLVGHAGSTVNNPHAAGLDCGACGGNSGEANARVVASILNHPGVRIALRKHGIEIPEDTWFLGGLHNTTTDEIKIFNLAQIPKAHSHQVEELKDWLAKATQLAQVERSVLLGLQNQKDLSSRIDERSRDWSQVRPEWGLAGNTAFIVGPRSFTSGASFQGRSFLHTYDWRLDNDFSVLELIMTAPMIVASWINLQYYASTVNNPAFGSGNKVLHNVTGTIGVIEGNAGDLRVGLPWQSVHDGNQFVHKPLRLNVMLAAPIEAINAVIKKHSSVRDLVDNRWIHLYAISNDGRVSHKYASNQNWIAQ